MGFDFNKLKSDIVSVGKDVGNKVSDVSAVARLKMDIHNKEDFIEKQFTELGRAYYLAHREEEEIPEKEFFKPIAEAEAPPAPISSLKRSKLLSLNNQKYLAAFLPHMLR